MKIIISILFIFLVSSGSLFADKTELARSYCQIGDYKKCAEYYQKMVIERNDPIAANNLASLYLDGKGVEKNGIMAVELFKASILYGVNDQVAKQYKGAPETSLGWIYLTGEYPGVNRDAKKALMWTLKATNYGHTNAYSNLALMYATGFGVETDYVVSVTNLIKSVEAFHKIHNWILNKDDKWKTFLVDGSTEIWSARRLYWKAIKTGDPYYLGKLRLIRDKLKQEEVFK